MEHSPSFFLAPFFDAHDTTFPESEKKYFFFPTVNWPSILLLGRRFSPKKGRENASQARARIPCATPTLCPLQHWMHGQRDTEQATNGCKHEKKKERGTV